MKKIFHLSVLLLMVAMVRPEQASACFSYFTYERACAGDTVWFHPIDPSAVYCWTFGDSLSPENVSFDQNPWHVYTSPGTYYVTLFTNIGAEWDYYTTIVEISTTCFMADFTHDCYGSLQVEFSDYSVGEPINWQWDFGDSASGASNVSLLASPSHTFTLAGSYNVQLIISDGYLSDTIVRVVTVYDDCIDAVFAQTLILPCWGDTFQPIVSYSGSIASYLWNFGDPSSGTADTSGAANPIHVYWSPGMYIITLVISNGIMFDTTYLYVEVVDCRIWPGDVNRDGEVNGDDLFGIGIYYGNAGTIRPGATSGFTPQTAIDWPGFTNFMYLQDILNAKHADCDGNGTIGATDVSAIANNFGMRSSSANNQSAMLDVPQQAPELGFAVDSIDAVSGATAEVPLSLGITDSALRVYGFSLSIDYDPFIIGWVSVDLYNSWLGNEWLDMLVVSKDDPMEGVFHLAAVRTDKTTRSGMGEIARIYFHPYAWSGTSPVSIRPSAKVISNGQAPWMNNQMVVIPVELNEVQVNFIAGLRETSVERLELSPNPALDHVNLFAGENTIQIVEVFSVFGELMMSVESDPHNNDFRLNVADLSAGLYQIKVLTSGGVINRSFIKL